MSEDRAESSDWQVIDAHSVMLNCERSGNGSGRIYTIGITCSDSSGAASRKTVRVTVPKK